jgi:hypothetical protein
VAGVAVASVIAISLVIMWSVYTVTRNGQGLILVLENLAEVIEVAPQVNDPVIVAS